jgi:hypothetical protein
MVPKFASGDYSNCRMKSDPLSGDPSDTSKSDFMQKLCICALGLMD